MLISISYYWGDTTKNNYVNNLQELSEFIKKFKEIHNEDYTHFDITIYEGAEEKRVRGIQDVKQKQDAILGVKE